MPDLDLEDVLQTALDAVRGKKTQAKLDEALTRKFSLADLREAYADASEEDRAEFREMFGGTPGQVIQETKEKEEAAKPKPKPRLRAAPPPEKQTRPGRKAGSVYPWTVDDDGRVTQLEVARVYNGPDEDDEVELPDDLPPADEDDETAAEDDAA